MASLTHVCMWSEKGWRRITAAEAARLHPGGTVSAHSGLFMCELCGQYVMLTDGNVQVRHFRHSSAEKSKDCPERTFGPGTVISYSAGEHELPIRISNIKRNSFELEIGFIQVPSVLLSKQLKIEIKLSSYRERSIVYSNERINPKGITYLSIGGFPSEKYFISISGGSEDIYSFWPKSVLGIDPAGTIFDATSGKKLVSDSDVVIGKKYYLLRRGTIFGYQGSHITINEILCKSISWEVWRLYEVTANDYTAETARFFLDYHCRLTDNPVSIQTVWPVYIESPYVIKHNKNSVVVCIMGNAPITQTFPNATKKSFPSEKGKVFEIACNSRQQLISAGRTKVLQYTYFWKEPLNKTTKKQVVKVTDLLEEQYEEAVYNNIPYKGALRFTIPYDGVLCVRKKNRLVNKIKIPAKKTIELDEIGWGMEIDIRIGLDIVWKAAFVHRKTKAKNDEELVILHRLQSYGGRVIAIPHSLGNLTEKLIGYPKIQNWLYKCIKSGYMSEKAYRDLQSLIISKSYRDTMDM